LEKKNEVVIKFIGRTISSVVFLYSYWVRCVVGPWFNFRYYSKIILEAALGNAKAIESIFRHCREIRTSHQPNPLHTRDFNKPAELRFGTSEKQLEKTLPENKAEVS